MRTIYDGQPVEERFKLSHAELETVRGCEAKMVEQSKALSSIYFGACSAIYSGYIWLGNR